MRMLDNRNLHEVLLASCFHMTLSFLALDFCSGGMRLKRDVFEYLDFIRSFKAPAVDEKFELLAT